MPCDGSRLSRSAQISGFFASIRPEIAADNVDLSLVPALSAQVNLEVHQRVILFERPDIRNVEMRRVEQIELSLHIKVKQSLHGMMGRNDAARHAGVGCRLLYFRPVLVAADLWAGWYRNRRSVSRRWIFYFCAGHFIGYVVRRQRTQRLAVVLGHGNIQADLFEVNLHTFVRIIAEDGVDGHDTCRKWRLLRELRLVVGRVSPWLSRNGHALMGFEGRGFERGLRLLGYGSVRKNCSGKKGNYNG